jgi:hypothetical protein
MVGWSSSDDDVRPPTGLKAPGRWGAVVGPYVLTPAELAMLGEACRTADELDRLEKAVRALPDLVTTGSTGQLKPHPLLEEVRRHRLLLERLTSALNLPDDTEEVGTRATVGMPGRPLRVGGGRGPTRVTASSLSLERPAVKAGGDCGDASSAACREDSG